MYAAIGTDGIRNVVWGMGETAEDAIAEAREGLIEAGLGLSGEDDPNGIEIRTQEISQGDVDRINAGDVAAERLGRR